MKVVLIFWDTTKKIRIPKNFGKKEAFFGIQKLFWKDRKTFWDTDASFGKQEENVDKNPKTSRTLQQNENNFKQKCGILKKEPKKKRKKQKIFVYGPPLRRSSSGRHPSTKHSASDPGAGYPAQDPCPDTPSTGPPKISFFFHPSPPKITLFVLYGRLFVEFR